MLKLFRMLLRIVGVLCLLAGAIPLLGYGILNTGTVAIALLGALLLALPAAWHRGLAAAPRLRRLLGVLCAAGLLFCAVVSALMVWFGWCNPPPDTGDAPVIVLGSKINEDRPSLMLQRRLDKAAEYLASHPDAVCVVSGGQGADEDYPEAWVMKNYLVAAGIAEQRVLQEDRSTNTRQNLRYSRELLSGLGSPDKAVIVTDGFHQLRAHIFATSEGLTCWSIPSLTPWGLLPSYWIREILGVSWAWLSIRLGIA